MRRSLVLVALCLLPAVFAGACGGGGGGGVVALPPNLYAGTYHYVGFSGLAGGAEEVATGLWGRLDADGAGSVTGGNVFSNANGFLSGPDPLNAFQYDVGVGRRLMWSFGGPMFAEGGISADGRTAALASVQPGSNPALYFTTLVSGTFDASSLNGLYHAVIIFYNDATNFDVTHWGTVTFDGVNMATIDVDTNVGGTINSPPPFATTYAVGADGKASFDYVSIALEGGVLEGGDLVILSGSSTAVNLPGFMVLVKGSAASSAATLNGSYHALGFTATVGGVPAWGAFTTTATADGVSALTFQDTVLNADGVIAPLGGGTLSYTVMADGTLDVTTGEATKGGVSPNGDFAVFGGGTAGGDAPAFWFLMR